MKLNGLTGSIVALITPFHEDGSVNFHKLGELVEFHLSHGTDGILTLGTTGESATMTHEEDLAVCKFVIEQVAGRVPVIAGSGSNCTQTMLEKSLAYEEAGADGLLLITPYYNKANAEGMYRHFTTVADAVHIPCLIYNVPGRTGCKISPDVVRRLSVHPNVMAIKEASGDIGYAMKVARYLSDDFTMYSGNDDITIPLMSLGASGVISVWANVMPRTVHDMVTDYLAGRHEKALQTQLRYLDLINALFMEVNPIPVKTAMNLMGLQAGHFRMPMYPMAPENLGRLKRIMREAGLPVQEAAE